MKYMLMMHAPGKDPYEIMTWPKQALDAHAAFMRRLNQQLAAAGELAGVAGLAGEASMAPGRDGEPLRMPIEVREVMLAIDPADRANAANHADR
jgi:hypothetical protein